MYAAYAAQLPYDDLEPWDLGYTKAIFGPTHLVFAAEELMAELLRFIYCGHSASLRHCFQTISKFYN